jgi:aryl-alcohol dehydrogenase-like predicted oxidoreductase
METRRFGRTGHQSSIAIFGAVAFIKASQCEADEIMEKVVKAGVNHIDVAPEYGLAEERVGACMPRLRQHFFLGCKTMERTREGSQAELKTSLRKLQVEALDLYQLHAVTTFADLDAITAPGGALETLIEARQDGATRYLGVTSHGLDAPAILLEALRRFDFDSVLFPVNYALFRNSQYRQEAETLIARCRALDVGIMAIKSVCKGPWGERQRIFTTWYEPFTDPENIQKGVDFVLSQDVTGLCTAGEISLVEKLLNACQNYRKLAREEQEALIQARDEAVPLWP